MTSVVPDVDERTKQDLQPSCEVVEVDACLIHGAHRHRCDQAATWIVRTTCVCGLVDIALICDPHADEVRRRHCGFYCQRCGALNQTTSTSLEKL